MTEIGADLTTVPSIASFARALYGQVKSGSAWKQRLRPYICPFHVLVGYVGGGATVLDVGCGAGLFIAILAQLGRIRSALGFDADQRAILTAQKIARHLPNSNSIRFEHRSTNDVWPSGQFDVVCLIDVMHHVQPKKQPVVLATAAEHVAPGGILLYKDMARRPIWRAWANRLHDLVSAGEWIHYAKKEDVLDWARRSGLFPEEAGAVNMLWYRHEWCIFRRSNA